MAKFYANTKTGEIRVLSKISDNSFIVFKHINGCTATMKYWNGNLERTVRCWNTIEYDPSLNQAMALLSDAKRFFEAMTEELHLVIIDNPFEKELDQCHKAWEVYANILPLREVFKLRYSMISDTKVRGRK